MDDIKRKLDILLKHGYVMQKNESLAMPNGVIIHYVVKQRYQRYQLMLTKSMDSGLHSGLNLKL